MSKQSKSSFWGTSLSKTCCSTNWSNFCWIELVRSLISSCFLSHYNFASSRAWFDSFVTIRSDKISLIMFRNRWSVVTWLQSYSICSSIYCMSSKRKIIFSYWLIMSIDYWRAIFMDVTGPLISCTTILEKIVRLSNFCLSSSSFLMSTLCIC